MKSLVLMVGLVLASSTLAFGQEQGGAIELGCDAFPGHVCHFLITRGAARSITKLESGKRVLLNSLRPNVDWYMVAIDRDPPSDPTACGKGFACKRATFKQGYNN